MVEEGGLVGANDAVGGGGISAGEAGCVAANGTHFDVVELLRTKVGEMTVLVTNTTNHLNIHEQCSFIALSQYKITDCKVIVPDVLKGHGCSWPLAHTVAGICVEDRQFDVDSLSVERVADN